MGQSFGHWRGGSLYEGARRINRERIEEVPDNANTRLSVSIRALFARAPVTQAQERVLF